MPYEVCYRALLSISVVEGLEATHTRRSGLSVFHLPGFSRDFDCFDSENEWDGKVVFVGF